MRKKILIADTNEDNIEILSELFSDDYEIIEASDGAEALNKILTEFKDLAAIILDAALENPGTADILAKISRESSFEVTPVMIMSEDTSLKVEKAMYKAGATEFQKKPFDSSLVKRKILKLIDLYSVREQLIEERRNNKQSAGATGNAEEEATYKSMHDNMIELIGRLVEFRNPENHQHVRRMKGLIKIMALKLQELYPEYNLTNEKIDIIVSAAALHDIGKAAIPDAVLLKPGRFTNEEYEYMKSHTLRGIDLLDSINGTWSSEYDEVIRKIVRSHHEKYDGGGYPDGLKGDDIPVEAQLISIADTYDALVNDRVYKKAFPKDVAFNMINKGDCGIFPPKILECFKESRDDLEAWENGELDLQIL